MGELSSESLTRDLAVFRADVDTDIAATELFGSETGGAGTTHRVQN